MLHDLFPDDVVVVSDDELAADDDMYLSSLFPDEMAQIGDAVYRRRADFAGARACAREAMRRLAVPEVSVPRGDKGMPVWPEGVIGTITHTEGLRAAALARKGAVRSLGVDVEVDQPLAKGVLEAVSLPEEARWVREATERDPRVNWGTVLFTAKEATYKTWFPLARRWLGFADARITLTTSFGSGVEVSEGHKAYPGRGQSSASVVAGGAIRSEILVDPSAVDGGPDLTEFQGSWISAGGFVATAIVLRPVAVDSVEG